MLSIKDPLLAPYGIAIEENQYVLYKTTLNKNQKEVDTAQGYFTSLGTCLQRIARLQIVDGKKDAVLTLREFMDLFTDKLKAFTTAFNPANA